MAGSTWDIYKYTSSWVADGTIPRPNEDLVQETISTQQRIKLADGSLAFFTPEIKTEKQVIVLSWVYQTKSLKDKIETYMTNIEYLKIVTHVSGLEFIGRFTVISPRWLVGVEDTWDIQATFELME